MVVLQELTDALETALGVRSLVPLIQGGQKFVFTAAMSGQEVVVKVVSVPAGPQGDITRTRAHREVEHRVRGICYYHKNDFGFMRFLRRIDQNLWMTDAKHPESPYGTAWFHDSSLPQSSNGAIGPELPSRKFIFEFKLVKADGDKGLRAIDIQLVAEM